MNKNDEIILNLIPEIDDEALQQEESFQNLEKQAEELGSLMQSDNMYSLTNSSLWEMIYKYIMENIDEFLKGQKLSIKMHIRYNFCLFVIPLLPTEYFLVFPSFYKKLLPQKMLNQPTIVEFIKAVDGFLDEVKSRKYTEILTVFIISRTVNLKDELEIIKEIPRYIKEDPIKVIRWLMKFNVEFTNSSAL
ncbi:hypothetical protein GINT2_001497 [Glugoides intestinalis]